MTNISHCEVRESAGADNVVDNQFVYKLNILCGDCECKPHRVLQYTRKRHISDLYDKQEQQCKPLC